MPTLNKHQVSNPDLWFLMGTDGFEVEIMINMQRAIATVIGITIMSFTVMSPASADVATLELGYDTADSGTVQLDGVKVDLRFRVENASAEYEGDYVPILTVTAGGRTRRFTSSPAWNKYSLLQLAELDPTNDLPEIIFSTYSGGAHCCAVVQVITQGVDGSGWDTIDVGMFDGGLREVSDLDGDGVYEYATSDNRFLYLYSSYAGSYPPAQVLALSGSEVLDVSLEPRFEFIHRQRVQEMWQAIQAASQDDYEVNGVLAGYVATKAILGELDSGWQLMLQRYDRTSDWGLEWCDGNFNDQGECLGRSQSGTYPEALQHFLTEAGYLSGDEVLPLQ